ncbi:MAG: hypothetical protein AAF645_09090 [Myxococcota bacterium]
MSVQPNAGDAEEVSLRARLADVFYTWSWRLPGRRWRRLFAFAAAEAESALELRYAAARTESPERAALYLRHAEDEARHARILLHWARQARGQSLPDLPRAHAQLFRHLGENVFLAFVHRGERRGRRQFEAHVRFFSKRDPRLAAALRSILADEVQHERYTGELAEHECRKQARRFDVLHRYRRAGAALTYPLFAGLMALLYVLASPLSLLLGRAPRGWQAARRSTGGD